MQPLQYTPLNNFSQQDVDTSKAQYGQAQQAYNTQQQQLSDFQKGMQSGTDMYQQQLALANKNAAYDPTQITAAQNQISQIQGIMGGLPRAVQASNANYGATAGDVASQYATQAQNINQTLGLANTNYANQLQSMQGGLAGAQAATTAGLQGQQQRLGALQDLAQNSLAAMDQARQVMQNYETLFQNQGSINAQQLANYNNARAAYYQAEAQMRQADAAYAGAQAQLQALKVTQDAAARAAGAGSKPITGSAPSGGGGFNLGNIANSVSNNSILSTIGKDASKVIGAIIPGWNEGAGRLINY